MYFSRCFRRYMKLSPSDFRKQHLTNTTISS
ncbi:hypothetical protein EOPP23_09935 [Endozoicomonas sp. OPT23]|nr:hypothetical protein [Endozoicomonas sp. OPT23]